MSNQLVLYEVVNNIAILTLNHPEKRNALSEALLLEMKARLEEANQDRDVRVVIIRANGKVFSSGHDLRELMDRDEESYARVFAICTEVMEAIRLLPKPVIAQVQGLATAAGCQLVATCDLAVASEDAAFATPGVKIGLFCTTPGVALARAVTTKKAMEMLLTGAPIPAEEALAWGLINKVVPPTELERETAELAGKIASASSYTVSLGKEAFYLQVEMDRPAAYQFAQRVMVENLLSHDAQEGIDSFLNKRQPRWES
jgi:enoyl-CoA hydratase/carnithine racemase